MVCVRCSCMLEDRSAGIGAKVRVCARWRVLQQSIDGGRRCVAVGVRGPHGGGPLCRPEIPGVVGGGGL